MTVKDNIKKHPFLFEKSNYIYLIIGILLNIIGFLLMIGGATKDPNVFNPDELFSTVRITIAPIVILLGYVVIFYSILKKPKLSTSDKEEE